MRLIHRKPISNLPRLVFALTLALVILGLFLPHQLQAAANITSLVPASGSVGQTVKLTGGVTCGNPYQIYWDSVTTANLLTQGISEAGCSIETYIVVPETTKGLHKVILRDAKTGEEASHDFTVIPAITVSPVKGVVGTTIIITGNGFAASEADIKVTYDGTLVKGGIAANDKGRWTTILSIPESPRGEHSLAASGAISTAAEVRPVLFTVTPKISLEPTSGGTGIAVTVTGTGFGGEEADIKITFDGLPVKTGISATKEGSFRTTFTVPTATRGEHIINASGATTRATDVPQVIFTVGAAILIQPTAGYVGDKVTVVGSGFAANETGIKVTYDGTEVATAINADANGAWVANFVAPPSTAGSHPVTSSGTTTAPESVAHKAFTILPRLVLNPTSGEVGSKVVATGTGFGKSQPVTITYDDIKLALEVATDPNGSFTATFKVPSKFGDKHEVNAKDNAGNRAVAIFTTETNPPPVPVPIAPSPKAKIGWVGKQIITFSWSPVADPSGVTYSLEISQQPDFSIPIFRGTDLVKTEYSLAKTEALEPGEYYWRVKAIDGAGNESDWTPSQPITVSRMTETTFLIILGVSLLVILLIVWRIITISRRGGWFEEY